MTDPKPRRKRRTKANIVASIDAAAIAEIAENGFVSSLVTNIIKNADIEPQVFYNRFKDINDFYDAFVRRYDNSLQEVLESIDDPLISKQGISTLLKEILRSINDDPVALELLRWEVSNKNKTTVRSSLIRELNFQPVVQGFMRCFKGTGIDIIGVFSILVGGVYYMSLHKKLSPMFGVDINTEDGREQFENAIEYIVTLLFDAKNNARREAEIADRLRALGVRDDVIAKALGNTPITPESNIINPGGDIRPQARPSMET